MIRPEEVYKIGEITKRHGVKGEMNLNFTNDVFDRAEAKYLILLIDGIFVPFFLESCRFKNNSNALISFEGIDSEEKTMPLLGKEVYFPHALTVESPDDEYTWNYFVGFSIYDAAAGFLGEVVHVDEQTCNTLFVVKSPEGRELLIPAQESFMVHIDHQKRSIAMELPEGLLSLDL